ncbi:DNA (cytosine-5-)-methyltransferase [Spiroplasma syrphidicola EA-1]|uniref:Cytosine-specific methyltransferase n=1 Tax=Spiroplasma syrphidicola EA-1 TaxID=1276229 RepID=R4UEK5_9MOLU|nr:DNA cytosine methyltransferase [Spiroplasma syrphidicola]AGM26359.1 DNA (cytosine-5-)-methyltransferase [Spiroplasma syrphidicola EA-1]
MNGLSLFANVGIAEFYLNKLNIKVKIASELKEDRAKFYKNIYPETNVIIGDIKEKYIFNKIISYSKKEKIDFIIATPPCQGMSTAGKNDWKDQRNLLIKYVIDIILELKPKYVFLENVPSFLNTKIILDNKLKKIIDILYEKLSLDYFLEKSVLNSADFGVPQIRKRAIILLTRKDIEKKLIIPKIKKREWKTVKDAIGDLESLNPIIKEEVGSSNTFGKENLHNKWHKPPIHCKRHVEIMKVTPTGKSAFDNSDLYKPKKTSGELIRGFPTTYKRIEWDSPSPTITMANGAISSQNNVHPGKKLEDGTYSDPRVLTILEIMRLTTLPDNWNIPEWASDNFIRRVIGEGVPPLFVYEILKQLK